MADRRDPNRQRPLLIGRRATDPNLTTRACANELGVSTDVIIGEIREGRLRALVIERPGLRAIYRTSRVELDAYKIRYRWNQPTQPPRSSGQTR